MYLRVMEKEDRSKTEVIKVTAVELNALVNKLYFVIEGYPDVVETFVLDTDKVYLITDKRA